MKRDFLIAFVAVMVVLLTIAQVQALDEAQSDQELAAINAGQRP